MLKTLRRIVQEVNNCNDFKQAMHLLVNCVREAMTTQSCTIFLIDPQKQHYVMMATDGLNAEAVGKVVLKLDEGIVGLVGQREEPINLSHAPSHPHYRRVGVTGEDRFKAFLGVPIIHHRHLLGVIIVQQEEERAFDDSEEAFLVTISAQLAGIIAHTQATGKLQRTLNTYDNNHGKHTTHSTLSGIPSVPGVGMGQGVVVYAHANLDAVPDKYITAIEEEIAAFRTALSNTQHTIEQLAQRMSHVLPASEQALFDVYERILGEDGIGKEVIGLITQGHWAQGALRQVINQHIQHFNNIEDRYLRERADDLRDLGQRVLACLQSQQKITIDYPPDTILLGEEITAAALAEVPSDRLKGIISARGSKNSHVAILARAIGIPTVMGVKGMDVCALEKQNLIIDGYGGQVYINPTQHLHDAYLALMQQEKELHANLEQLRTLPAQTPDGHCIALFINTGLNEDAGLSLSVGGDGVGLFRTEVPFMLRDAFPAEEEQRVIYRQLLQTFSPRPVIMRTLDIGGDKPLPYFPIEEANPFLGWRGIRITLDQPELFLIQLRAMLKASEGLTNLRIMFPMVSHVGEVDDALRLLAKAHREVLEEGVNVARPLVGVMIEVPSAVYQARQFAERVDFLSVGSNDLIQYLLAVDRNNARVADLYDALHPCVIKALMQTIDGAHSEGKHVSICGEMAGDPASVILLIAMGFDALSMNTISLPKIKWVVRNFTRAQAQQLLAEVLEMENPFMIRFHLEQALELSGLGGLIRAGK